MLSPYRIPIRRPNRVSLWLKNFQFQVNNRERKKERERKRERELDRWLARNEER